MAARFKVKGKSFETLGTEITDKIMHGSVLRLKSAEKTRYELYHEPVLPCRATRPSPIDS